MKVVVILLLASLALSTENPRGVSYWDRDRNLEFINFTSAPNSNRNVIVLHGMGGLASNFLYLPSDFKLKSMANWWLLTLRNHGNSFDDEVMTVKAMAEDVVRHIYKYNIRNISLIGYSIGGRVAMYIAANYSSLIDSMAILDFMPFAYPNALIQPQIMFLNSLLNLNISNMTYDQIKTSLTAALNPADLALVLSLLEGTGSDYRFACNITNIAAAVPTIISQDIPGKAFKKPVKFIFAKKSLYFMSSRVNELVNFYPNLDLSKDIIYLENSDHSFPFTQPELAIAFIYNFLSAN